MRLRLLLLLCLFIPVFGVHAQSDALNLPADLYVLLNSGQIKRYQVAAFGEEVLTPESVFVIDFGVSADGRQIAYRTQEGLFTAPLAVVPVNPTLVDVNAGVPSARGQGETIAWSPAGDAIAYLTLNSVRVYIQNTPLPVALPQGDLVSVQWSPSGDYLAAEANGDIWWLYRREGASLVLTSALPSSHGIAWVNDSTLAFAPAEGGLLLMDLAAANAQNVLLTPENSYRLPVFTQAGRLLAFERNAADTTIPEGFGLLVGLTAGVAGREVIGTTPIDLNGGLRWAPDGGLLVALEGGVLALFDPVNGSGFPLPITSVVAYTWGPVQISLFDTPTSTPAAIFPDTFPTLDPSATLSLPTPMVEGTPEVEGP